MAPSPASSAKIRDEWAGVPVTRSVQEDEPRRPITAFRGFPSPSSKPMAISAVRAAATSVRRAGSSGSPGFSSSPPRKTVMARRSRRPAEERARSACTRITSPPFMSITPGPRACMPSRRSNRWNGLSGSKTVSRCPMRRRRGPGPARSPIRCPARRNGPPSSHRVAKPRASSSRRKIAPTSRTPARFSVPLLMFTTRSRSSSASPLWASTYSTMARSSSPGRSGAAAPDPAAAPLLHPPALNAVRTHSAMSAGRRRPCSLGKAPIYSPASPLERFPAVISSTGSPPTIPCARMRRRASPRKRGR